MYFEQTSIEYNYHNKIYLNEYSIIHHISIYGFESGWSIFSLNKIIVPIEETQIESNKSIIELIKGNPILDV